VHISFSSLKDWNDCPYKFKIYKVDGIRAFLGNEHTSFGSAMHYIAEFKADNKSPKEPWETAFEKKFVESIKECKENGADVGSFDKKLISNMRDQGKELIPLIKPALDKYFGNYEVFSIELELNEPIKDYEGINFLGYVDLIVKTPQDDKLHLIDWKTCSWGWDARKKSDTMANYQLVLYKHFLSERLGVDPKMMETHFGLLKRVGKDLSKRVELFRITSGPKKTENALKLLNAAASNYKNNYFPKNRLSCSKCPFHKTKHCP
jgi:hypothetical protein